AARGQATARAQEGPAGWARRANPGPARACPPPASPRRAGGASNHRRTRPLPPHGGGRLGGGHPRTAPPVAARPSPSRPSPPRGGSNHPPRRRIRPLPPHGGGRLGGGHPRTAPHCRGSPMPHPGLPPPRGGRSRALVTPPHPRRCLPHNHAMQTPHIVLRPAHRGDVPRILELIRALAEYERLAHEVEADEDRLADTLFGPAPCAEVV